MPTDKLKVTYIASLLVLGALLIFFAQGVFTGLSKDSAKPLIEINRVDLYDDFLGNYSTVSIKIANNDTVNHYFSIKTFNDGELKNTFNTTINTSKTFTYKVDLLPEKVPISWNETVNSTLQVAKFEVYIDNQTKPYEEASFVFRE